MTELERFEWCDFWWEEADKQHKPRVLLIGDSITKAYRPYVNQLLEGKVYVDMLATSKAIDNPNFLRELDYIIRHREDFKYTVVHINNGLHGWHLSTDEYEYHYSNVIAHLIEHSQPAQIAIAYTTPKTIEGDTTQYDVELNGKVIERNAVVDRIAKSYHLTINDLYTPLYDISKFRVNDGYHYNTDGVKAQSELVANVIERLLPVISPNLQ